MHQSLDDIADLAEDLGNRFISRGRVNLEKIARNKRIHFIKGNYGSHFLGQLVHYANNFYILLNTDQLTPDESGRVRFTIAHELGHYFIDKHRTKLAKGISLSFECESFDPENKSFDTEANHFASHLLMPRTLFCKLAQKREFGLDTILFLKKKFDVSIYATTLHYIHLNLSASIMIKWNPDYNFRFASYSQSFSNLTNITGKPPVRFPLEYVREIAKTIEENAFDYYETASPISKWISTISPGSNTDFIGLEQTIILGDFGGITLLTFQQ